MTGLTRISEVLNLAGVKNNSRPFNEGDVWFVCPDCGLGQTAGQATVKDSDDPRRITEYACGSCDAQVAAVVHWGVQAQTRSYRLGSYAIETPVPIEISVEGSHKKVVFGSVDEPVQ
ncbi:hypothetical protein [Paenarthrobacter ureafaciens]|uniref:hypothetical protein n=1 Tax=Paenarthrobacter ureafaciens TaxID=37931 RepID=UPI003464E3E8